MSRFTLTIETDNEAFTPDRGAETSRLLREVAYKIDNGHEDGAVLDQNGNRVGLWAFTGEQA